jgi:N-acyl-D-amino-acid deacylase
MLRSLLYATLLFAASAATGADYDLLIRGGTVIDGTGQPGFAADVGVRDGKIAFIGDAGAASAKRIVDATGLVVAPGFIDTHNHSVDQLVEEDFVRGGPITNEAYLLQGVTTVVGGPDGVLSLAQIKRVLNRFGTPWLGTNYAFYAGHNGIRAAVMGSAQRAPTPSELADMKRQVREAMELGAVGLSSGLMYEPGMFSKPAELIALAREVKPYDGIYDSHVRNPGTDLIGSDAEAIEVGRAAGIPVKIAHEKAAGQRNFGLMKQIIGMIEAARAEGIEVVTDQYPYDGAATSTLEGIIVVPGAPEISSRRFAATDEEARALLESVQAALRDPARRPRIAEASVHGIDGGFSWIKAVGYGAMRIVDSSDYPELIGKNLETLAREAWPGRFRADRRAHPRRQAFHHYHARRGGRT